jgi:adenosylhomocysteine nucleosidase
MKYGLIGPSKEEIDPFIELMESKKSNSIAMLDFHEGTFHGIPVIAVFSGACKVNATIATQILVDRFNISHLIHVGVAGALKSNLKIGDIIIPNELAYHDVLPEILTEYHPWMKDEYFRPDKGMFEICIDMLKQKSPVKRWFIGKAITGEAFIHTDERSELTAKHDPYCVDMESAAVAHTCYVNNIPFIVIRSISDKADDQGPEEFESNVVSSSLNAVEVASEFIRYISKK